MKPPDLNEILQRQKRGKQIAAEGNLRKLPEQRHYVLSTFNVALMEPLLIEALDRAGFHATVEIGPFGQIAGEALNKNAALYAAPRDGVALILSVEDLLTPLYARPATLGPEAIEALVRDQSQQVAASIDALLANLPEAVVYVVVVGADTLPMESILAPEAPLRGQAAVATMIDSLHALRARSPRVVVVDWDWASRADGLGLLRDARLWYIGRMRLNQLGLGLVADGLAQHVAAYTRPPRKVAVVDLDNTLWGGVVGEVGLAGIVLGEEGIGLAFQDFQRELLKLRDVGVVLAVCSKNNPDDAWEVFERHPAMILKREHIAASRINWQDKAANLREIAAELNLGVDSFVFLDDNAVERQWVRSAIDSVLVPELPDDPVERPQALRRATYFQRIAATAEDVGRAETYRAQQLRVQLQSTAATYDDFLASLEQEVTIEDVSSGSLSRAVQLCQRTNQFNLTTSRYSVADVEQLMRDPQAEVFTLALRDRFGDSGITGLAILRYGERNAEIDTLLLSCRILGRKIEDALLDFLVQRCRARGATRLRGKYVATAKNQQVSRFYADRGFADLGGGNFELDVDGNVPATHSAIKVTVPCGR